MPFPTFFPSSSPAGVPRPLRRTAPLLLASAALACAAAAVGATPGLVLLLGACAFLLAAAVVGLRAHWSVAMAGESPAAPRGTAPLGSPLETIPRDLLGLHLRGLQERAADQVSRALEDGREDLARELSDGYADDALRAITAAGQPPAHA